MAQIRACFCVLAAMAICFGNGARAGRFLQQVVAPSPSPTASCPDPDTVDVSLSAYSGVWYEIASTALFKQLQESDLVCIQARYSVIPSGDLAGSLRIRNEGYNTSSGEGNFIIGSATVVSEGRLAVSFFPGAPGDYRIIYLSGAPEEGYKTAIVYGCEGSQGDFQALYILSRTPKLDADETVAGLLEFAEGQGIELEPYNQLVITPQDPITCGRNFH